MRTYGRTYDAYGNPTWVEVITDSNGFNDEVYITTLAQVLKLNRGESPFWANYGIPGQQSVMTQVFPDYYVALTQQQFSGYFSSLTVSKLPSTTPTYQLNVVTTYGAVINATVQIPT